MLQRGHTSPASFTSSRIGKGALSVKWPGKERWKQRMNIGAKPLGRWGCNSKTLTLPIRASYFCTKKCSHLWMVAVLFQQSIRMSHWPRTSFLVRWPQGYEALIVFIDGANHWLNRLCVVMFWCAWGSEAPLYGRDVTQSPSWRWLYTPSEWRRSSEVRTATVLRPLLLQTTPHRRPNWVVLPTQAQGDHYHI